ncbi:MAG: hypothetical protein FJY56_07885 [Betaproteobacteria bacterium]|nr:hypothetical protein [Betaproteobacteria bacterium]
MMRVLLIGLTLSFALCSAAALAKAQRWDFQVFLDDTAIGHHHFVLRDNGAERELSTDARFAVKLLFVTAYRYAHKASERWRGNCLTNLIAQTDDNGKFSNVNAEQHAQRVIISSPRGRETVDGCVMSFAYWNPQILRQTRLLNSQTGEHETVSIAAMGDETITVRGAPVQAKRYRIIGPKNPIDLWYGADQQWLALQSTLEGGRRLRYELKLPK